MLKFEKTSRFDEVMLKINTEGINDAEQVMLDGACALGQVFNDGAYVSSTRSPLTERGGSYATLWAKYTDDDEIVVTYQSIPIVQTAPGQKPGAQPAQ